MSIVYTLQQSRKPVQAIVQIKNSGEDNMSIVYSLRKYKNSRAFEGIVYIE
jgi:hypothetical protein